MPDPGALNSRGPCSSCGAQLASDQRYCVECGQRVGPPMALPFALPPAAPPPAAGSWLAALPMPAQMVSAFAALALGFGAVVGTAISPNLRGILAAPSPPVVAEAPPETPPISTGGGGGGAPSPSGGSAPALATSTAAPASSGSGGGGGGGGGKKKKKKQKQQPPVAATSGVVVRANPVAQSYTIASGGNLIAIHASSLPQVGEVVEVDTVRLLNGTFQEGGARSVSGTAAEATFSGIVTYCEHLEDSSEPCSGTVPEDHYVYTVSSLGASVLVSRPAALPAPRVGDTINVTVNFGAPLPPVEPLDGWASDPDCTPPYDEQNGRPSPPLPTPGLIQQGFTAAAPAQAARVEAVLQTVCPGEDPRLVLSADDIREADRDLLQLPVPNGIDLGRLTPGQAVMTDVAIDQTGSLTLRGITSDQGTKGADDPTQGQGTLAGI